MNVLGDAATAFSWELPWKAIHSRCELQYTKGLYNYGLIGK